MIEIDIDISFSRFRDLKAFRKTFWKIWENFLEFFGKWERGCFSPYFVHHVKKSARLIQNCRRKV